MSKKLEIEFKAVGVDVEPKVIEADEFDPSFLLNEANRIASFLGFGFMVRDTVKGFHWLRVFFQNGVIDIKANDLEGRMN